MAVSNWDNALLEFYLYKNGERISEYHSCSSFFDFGNYNPDLTPIGGDAVELCNAFVSGDSEVVERTLRNRDVFQGNEEKRHMVLARLLGLPDYVNQFQYGAPMDLLEDIGIDLERVEQSGNTLR